MPSKNIDNIYKIIFDNANDIILYLSKEEQILAANKMALDKYGYAYDELISMYMQNLRHHPMDPACIYQMTLHQHNDNGIVFETVHVRKDGTSFPVEISSTTVVINGDEFKICIVRDITIRKRIEEKILYLANYDSLTNIANRANIISQLDKAIEKARITSNNIGFVIFDLDKFKVINDTFGHPVGDKVLHYVAQTVKKSLRANDAIGRFGGDEFVVILQNIKGKDDILALVNRICSMFKDPILIGNNSIQINISMGISETSEKVPLFTTLALTFI